MRIIITGKGITVSDYLKNLFEKKENKLDRYFKPDTEMYVTMSIEKSRHIVEVTVPFDGVTLRCEEATGDMYASIDLALRKLERQIRKHRTKLEKKLHEGAFDLDMPVFEDLDEEDDAAPKIVRTKRFAIKPMSVEEAQMQMELLGHSFFVFRNAQTDEVNVLYQRNDGNLGLIEPDYE